MSYLFYQFKLFLGKLYGYDNVILLSCFSIYSGFISLASIYVVLSPNLSDSSVKDRYGTLHFVCWTAVSMRCGFYSDPQS